ncbi:MAG: tetratricopeptide repeat protein [Streptomyces sp.]|nr:tetratricopeptide repeat protein [Streptomyces sp.]NUT29770.1 tetratricopeptide repeat protein [Streptomyces sp.]
MGDGGTVEGRASGQGRVFQTTGEQYIEEHHHHYAPGTAPLLGGGPVRPAVTAADSVRVPLVGRPPGILRNREELRRTLSAAIAGPGGEVHVVHGMGGLGKTAVAYWLFTQAVREHGRAGLWVNASDRVSLRAGMLAVAGDRGATTGELAAAASGQRAAADLVWHYLDHSSEPWLLVLDNADDPAILEEGGWLRTSPLGTVLVTTRIANSPLWRASGVSRHTLGLLPLQDAAQVLCDLAPDAGTPEAARKVAERLGRLPLALTLAGSHLAHQLLESWTMDEYERKLTEESTAIVDQGAAGRGSGQSRQLVSRTWQLSLDALREQGLPEATSLLRLLSCWAADPVPLTMLMPAARGEVDLTGIEPALSADRLEPALRGLLDHSLIELVQLSGARCVSAHGVLLDSVAGGVPAGPQRAALGLAAARLLSAALPDPDDTSEQARAALAVLAPHAVALLRVASGEVSEEIGRVSGLVVRRMYEAGDWSGSLALAERVAERTGQLLGAEHPVALDTRFVLGQALHRMGRYAEAEALHRQVLAARERVLGPDHPDTLRSCLGLRYPLEQLDGRREEAEQLNRRAIEGQRRVLGEDSAETLYSRACLLEVLPQIGKAEEFDAEARALVEDCERFLPPDHLTTLMARHLHGYGLLLLGRHEEAEPLAQRTLADRRRVQGPEHPFALSALALNARVLRGLGRTDEALPLLEQLIEIRDRTLGPEHPAVVELREWLTEWQR